MVVAFVGFVGAHVQQVLGADRAFLVGRAGGGPGHLSPFPFFLAGGPSVESAHN